MNERTRGARSRAESEEREEGGGCVRARPAGRRGRCALRVRGCARSRDARATRSSSTQVEVRVCARERTNSRRPLACGGARRGGGRARLTPGGLEARPRVACAENAPWMARGVGGARGRRRLRPRATGREGGGALCASRSGLCALTRRARDLKLTHAGSGCANRDAPFFLWEKQQPKENERQPLEGQRARFAFGRQRVSAHGHGRERGGLCENQEGTAPHTESRLKQGSIIKPPCGQAARRALWGCGGLPPLASHPLLLRRARLGGAASCGEPLSRPAGKPPAGLFGGVGACPHSLRTRSGAVLPRPHQPPARILNCTLRADGWFQSCGENLHELIAVYSV